MKAHGSSLGINRASSIIYFARAKWDERPFSRHISDASSRFIGTGAHDLLKSRKFYATAMNHQFDANAARQSRHAKIAFGVIFSRWRSLDSDCLVRLAMSRKYRPHAYRSAARRMPLSRSHESISKLSLWAEHAAETGRAYVYHIADEARPRDYFDDVYAFVERDDDCLAQSATWYRCPKNIISRLRNRYISSLIIDVENHQCRASSAEENALMSYGSI